MLTLRLWLLILIFGCITVLAGEPTGCHIITLNGTENGESWTSSFRLQPLVTLALRNPSNEPWQEIDIEFESKRGANIGTLQLENTDNGSKRSLTLTNWATSVYKQNGESQTKEADGHLKKLLSFEDWTYINVSVSDNVKVSAGKEKIIFGQVDARSFTSLYIRIPEGQELEVGFNCTEDVLHTETFFAPGAAEGASMAITIVGIIALLLLAGVLIFWVVGRKKKNALIHKHQRTDAKACEECSDLIDGEAGRNETEEKEEYDSKCKDEKPKSSLKQTKETTVEKCYECGDVIEDNKIRNGKKIGVTFKQEEDVEGECSCSDDDHKKKKKSPKCKQQRTDAKACEVCGDLIDGEKRRNAKLEKDEDNSKCKDEKPKSSLKQKKETTVEKCFECGDVIEDTKIRQGKKIGVTFKQEEDVEGECSCSDDDHK